MLLKNRLEKVKSFKIDTRKLTDKTNIGICGATSTPKWLMEEVAEFVRQVVGEETT